MINYERFTKDEREIVAANRRIAKREWHPNPLYLERVLHDHFAAKRMRGEWFLLTSSEVGSIEAFVTLHYTERQYLVPKLVVRPEKGNA